MVIIREPVGDFTLESFHQQKIKSVQFSKYRSKWIILFFYPGDFTFVCPTELSEAADYYQRIQKLGAEILSISTDSVYVHQAWHDSDPLIGKIKFPMLADPSGQVSQQFGVYQPAKGISMRATFIVDPQGILRALEIHDDSVGRSMAETIRKLQAAIYTVEHPGQVCPASWQPGDKSIRKH